LRKGFQGRAESKGGGGTRTYVRIDPINQSAVEELVTIDSNLWRLKSGTITITYLGSTDEALFEIKPVANTDGTYSFHCYITQGNVTNSDTLDFMTEAGEEIIVAESYTSSAGVVDINLGTGIETADLYTIAELVAEIDASAIFTATATGSTSGPAAFIQSGIYSFISNVATVPFSYWEQVYCPITDPFSAFAANFGTDNAELASLFNHAQRLFIATGKTSLYKYDALQVFKAGMPSATGITTATTGTGLTGTFSWTITYEQTDNLGVIVEGNPCVDSTLTLANQSALITIPCIQPSTGYLTSSAKVNGAQAGVNTITVDSGHTLQVGQTVFFYNSGGTALTRVVTAKTATTVTISGASFTVSDNEVISAQLKINLWRNKAGGAEKYLVKTFANDSSVATFQYTDGTADNSLGAQREPITTEYGLPPENLRYLTAYVGLLFGSKGDDRVYFCFPDDPEHFDSANSSFLLRSKSNMPVRGIGATRDILCAFKQNESHLISGDDFEGGAFSIQLLSDKIGCSSHSSIVDIQGTLWFYSAEFGVRRVYKGQIPDEVGYRVTPRTTAKSSTGSLKVVDKRVVALDIPRAEQVIYYFPCENSSPSYYPNENSFCLVADYKNQFEDEYSYDENGRIIGHLPRVSWWRWTKLNLGGGGDILEGELYWTEKRYSTQVGGIEYPLVRRYEFKDPYIYMDHCQPIDLDYQSHWVHKGQPDVLKKYLGAVIYCFPPDGAVGFSIYCDTEIDFLNDLQHSSKLLEFGAGGTSFGWGNWEWGFVNWGENIVPSLRFPFKLTRAKAVKIKLHNTFWNNGAVISGWDMEIVPTYKVKVKP
jgi:hypothetical protein